MSRNIWKDGVLIGQRTITWDEVRSLRVQWFQTTDLWYLKDRWDNLSSTHKGQLNSFREDLRNLPQTYSSANEAFENFPVPREWFR